MICFRSANSLTKERSTEVSSRLLPLVNESLTITRGIVLVVVWARAGRSGTLSLVWFAILQSEIIFQLQKLIIN